VCPNCSNNDDDSGGNQENPPPTPAQDTTNYVLTVNCSGSGLVVGNRGTYSKNDIAVITARPISNYIFGGWSGDLHGTINPGNIKMDNDHTVNAIFYDTLSNCGKLIKLINNGDLEYYRQKISGSIEYGYIKASDGTKYEGTGSAGRIALKKINNISEMVHTHELEIHLSQADLTSLFARFSRGEISDYVNFKYTIVSPEYFVVVTIDNPEIISTLLNDGFIVDDESGKKVLSEKYLKIYDKYLPITSNSVEGHFQNFIDFVNEANLGLKISLHRTNPETGELSSKFINSRQDVNDLLNNIGNCLR
jgi:hypothetical protein